MVALERDEQVSNGTIIGIGVELDPSGVEKGARAAERELNTLGDVAKKAGELVAGYFVFAKIKEGVEELARTRMEFEQGQARLNGVLRATGNAAGVSASQINDLAEEMDRSTLFSAAATRDATAQLLTFRSLSGPVITDAIKLSADLATIWKTDLTSAAFDLGKALEDPERGMMLLRRSGIVLSDAQQKIVKSAVAAGDALKAQQTILEAVRQRVGGSAEGASSGLTGAVDDLSDAWRHLKESMSDGVFSTTLQFWLGQLRDMVVEMKDVVDGWRMMTGTMTRSEQMSNLEDKEIPAAQARVAGLRHDIAGPSLGAKLDAERRDALSEALLEQGRLQDELVLATRGQAHDFRIDHAPGHPAPGPEASGAAQARAAAARDEWAQYDHERDIYTAGLRQLDDNENTRWEKRIARIHLEMEASKQQFDKVMQQGDAALLAEKNRDRKVSEGDATFLKAGAPEKATAFRELWKNAVKGAQDDLTGFFKDALHGNLKTFEDFTGRIVALFEDMLAQLASQRIMGSLSHLFELGGLAFGGSKLDGNAGPDGSGIVPTSHGPPLMNAGSASASRSAGGDTFHVAVSFAPSFIDGASGAAWLRAQRDTITEQVVEGVRRSTAARNALRGN